MRRSLLLTAVLLALVGCDRETTDWTPVMEETSTVFLRDQVDKSLEMLEALQVGEAVRFGSREAVPRFQQLIPSLNLKAMKGDLILNSDTARTQGG